MKTDVKTGIIAALLLAVSSPTMADVFDKAEAAKECLQSGTNCKGKWLGRIAAAKKCKQEGNCSEKINEAYSDKISRGIEKTVTFSKCMQTDVNDTEEVAKCYELAKGYWRNKQAKKEEAAQALAILASERKKLGDSVCLPGRVALGLVKVKVKGFVEQVSGERIQIRIADTQGQAVSYQGVSLWQNTLLWDSLHNWIACGYLK